MSFVVFDGDLVSLEVDYHDGGARLRSLQSRPTQPSEPDVMIRTQTSASSSASSSRRVAGQRATGQGGRLGWRG